MAGESGVRLAGLESGGIRLHLRLVPIVEALKGPVFQLQMLFFQVCEIRLFGSLRRELDALRGNGLLHGVAVITVRDLVLISLRVRVILGLEVVELLLKLRYVAGRLLQVSQLSRALRQFGLSGGKVLFRLVRFGLLPADVTTVLVKDLVDSLFLKA